MPPYVEDPSFPLLAVIEYYVDYFDTFTLEIPPIEEVGLEIDDGKISLTATWQEKFYLLDAIFESLTEEKDLDLDFVYGSVSEVNKTFIPLDGQQRLTTLYLLYWYIGSFELKDKEYDNLMSLLKKFTYSTRVSSRRFCEELMKTKLHFIKEPKEEITNLSWFFKSYKKTLLLVQMLNMLNAIHQKYIELDKSALYKELNRLQFYILPLNGFNLSEELYVK